MNHLSVLLNSSSLAPITLLTLTKNHVVLLLSKRTVHVRHFLATFITKIFSQSWLLCCCCLSRKCVQLPLKLFHSLFQKISFRVPHPLAGYWMAGKDRILDMGSSSDTEDYMDQAEVRRVRSYRRQRHYPASPKPVQVRPHTNTK